MQASGGLGSSERKQLASATGPVHAGTPSDRPGWFAKKVLSCDKTCPPNSKSTRAVAATDPAKCGAQDPARLRLPLPLFIPASAAAKQSPGLPVRAVRWLNLRNNAVHEQKKKNQFKKERIRGQVFSVLGWQVLPAQWLQRRCARPMT